VREDVSLKERIGYDAILGALNRQMACEIDWDQVSDLRVIGSFGCLPDCAKLCNSNRGWGQGKREPAPLWHIFSPCQTLLTIWTISTTLKTEKGR
jgi:hypothetical protein